MDRELQIMSTEPGVRDGYEMFIVSFQGVFNKEDYITLLQNTHGLGVNTSFNKIVEEFPELNEFEQRLSELPPEPPKPKEKKKKEKFIP